jgi:glycosyltransferase involved in cell wall biosynthesis
MSGVDSRPAAAVVIPALDEEAVIADLVTEVRDAAALPDLAARIATIIVVDNGSCDATAERAAAAGATVVAEPRRGYGRACLAGVNAAAVELIVFMDGDRSEVPAEMGRLLGPIVSGEADLVLGSRVTGQAEPGALSPQQRVGNAVAALLLRLLYGIRVTDLPPYRAIRRDVLLSLGMTEATYGWPVEMIARAGQRGLRIQEVPVTCRRRAGGVSKVSGNLRASTLAGYRIVRAILRVRRQASNS